MYIHFAFVAFMALYGLYRLRTLFLWLRDLKTIGPRHEPPLDDFYPVVTVQLPIYNEPRVAKRLIDSVCQIIWPEGKMEIQVLDDSTDSTSEIVNGTVKEWQDRGCDIKIFRRASREGYKAGALNLGLKHARGEYIAIFDADFLPAPDFLMRAISFFQKKDVGFVQARWGYINEENSFFTRMQAVFLNGHFIIEQSYRDFRGFFLNFNGTAGIWRKEAMISSGGWQSDTVTEDLDISFRAHLKGWKAIYLKDLVVESELPPTISAFRTQQRRWAKGSIQTAKKLLIPLWRSSANLGQKIDGTVHMFANLGWLCGFIIILTLLPALIARTETGIYQLIKIDLPLFICSTASFVTFFIMGEHKGRDRPVLPLLKLVWFLPAFSLGMAPAIAMGVIDGMLRSGGEFKRTPKFGYAGLKLGRQLLKHSLSPSWLIFNVSMGLYSMLPVIFAVTHNSWVSVPFLSLFPLGAFLALYLDLVEIRHSSTLW